MTQVVVIVRYRLAVDCGTETRRVDLIVSQAALSVFHRPVGGECWSDALDAPMQDDWTSVTLGLAPCVADHWALGRQERSSENT
jgi:hypothetical protein